MQIKRPKKMRYVPKGRSYRSCLALLSFFAVWPASAHDFWIQPQRFWLAVGVPTAVSLFVGHGPDRQLWDADITRIVRLTSIGPKGLVNQMSNFRQGGIGRLSFQDQGFHVVALETNSASSELPALRFNDYLAAEGLTPAIAFRQANRQTNMPGSEIYSRRAKVLLRVGRSPSANAAAVTRPIGLTLEIVPSQNPYTLPATAPLPFQIYFEGRPLAGATVMLNDLRADAKPVAKVISDGSGRVAFVVPRQGQWQVNVIWTKPLPQRAAAQFSTTFSSLTFGFDPPPN
jgi:uncharacterized GH25 family protein